MTPIELVLAVDIGGTKTAAALVTRDGVLLDERSSRTPGSEGPSAILDTVSGLVAELRAVAADRGDDVRALGVGSAGVIDSHTGTVLSATDVLADWAGTAVRAELLARTGLPVVAVDNDVHAHARGEAWTGAAAGARSVFFVGVGTGIGASVLIDGAVWHGHRQVAGHFGHLPAAAAGTLPCVCGGTGHLEAIGAGPAMVAAYNRSAGTDLTSLVQVAALAAGDSYIEDSHIEDSDAPGSGGTVCGGNHTVMNGSGVRSGPGEPGSPGDPRAAEVIASAAAAVGSAIGGAVNLLDPELAIVGGGVVGIGPMWWTPLERALRAELLPPLREIAVIPAQLGSSAALVGAARMAWEAL